jgi:hypothetical protein
MPNTGPLNPSFGSGKAPDDDNTPINKKKFKEELQRVEKIRETDPEGRAKKRHPSKTEEDTLKTDDGATSSSNSPGLLGSNQNVGSNAPSSSTDDDSSSTNSYQPVSESSSSSSTNTDNNPKKRSLGNSEPDMPFNPYEDDSDYSNDYEPPSSTPLGSPNTPSSPSYNSSQAPEYDSDFDYDEDYPIDTNFNYNSQPSTNNQTPSSNQTTSNEPHKNQEEAKHPSIKDQESVENFHERPKKVGTHLSKPHLDHESKGPSKIKGSDKLKTDAQIYKNPLDKPVHQEMVEPKKELSTKNESFSKKSKSSSKDEKIEAHKSDDLSVNATSNFTVGQVLPPMSQAPSPPESLPQASYLSPQVHELFQTMVGLVMMKQLTHEGMQGTQTEISLNNPEYENSQFYGLKIIITEYKTAPGAFNLELQGNGAQNALIAKESAKLISAFNDNRYNLPFTINRLDVSLNKEESDFLFKRKGSAKGGDQNSNDNSGK